MEHAREIKESAFGGTLYAHCSGGRPRCRIPGVTLAPLENGGLPPETFLPKTLAHNESSQSITSLSISTNLNQSHYKSPSSVCSP